jgi:hypothetical protein
MRTLSITDCYNLGPWIGGTYRKSTSSSSMALQPLWALTAFSSSLIYTQSVALHGRVISPSQGRYLHTGQHKHRTNAHRHPCLECDSNPRSLCSSGRRQFMPQTARPLWWAENQLISFYTGQKRLKILIRRSVYFRMWGSHSGGHKQFYLQGYNAV